MSVVKCCHGTQVNWSRFQDTGFTDPALVVYLPYKYPAITKSFTLTNTKGEERRVM